MQVFGVALAGFGVSFVFSMVGAGGSQVMVPLLFWMGLDFKTGAIPLALLESAVTCFSAGVVYSRSGLVLMSVAVPFAISVLVAAPLGALVNFGVSSNLLMFVFAISNMVVGLAVLRGKSVVTNPLSRRSEITLCVVAGLAVGFFIGMIGRDGAPFVLAALVLVGYDAREAAGTSSIIVAAGCLAAFLVHLTRTTVGWELFLAGSLACLLGSQLGSRLMTERMGSRSVELLFATIMFVVGLIILIQAL